jgi:glucose-6-phosphate dehydrogenase assembly protein OpcA
VASDLSPAPRLTWHRDGTTPAAVADAIRQLLRQCHAESTQCVPARALNMICVVDAERAGAVAERLDAAGRNHASRTIVCAVHAGERASLGATATIESETDPAPGHSAVLRETIALDVGERHLRHLDTVVDPLVVSDLPTVAWLPDHEEAVAPLLNLAQAVLVDSVEDDDLGLALRRADVLRRRAHVVDLAWLRSTPWRERMAGAFDPPDVRGELMAITALSVRHEPASRAVAVLLAGWLGSRLHWRMAPLEGGNGEPAVSDGEVRITLSPVRDQRVRGLSGVTIETASGRRLSLDRAPGGMAARLRGPDGDERTWTVLGASRGEHGVLGEGVRQALLRDPAYGDALAGARALVPDPDA